MTHRVWKFKLSPDVTELDLPLGAAVLMVGHQDDDVFLWAECDPSASIVHRAFVTIPTGSPFPSEGTKYVGSVQMPSSIGELVFHVFELHR